MSNKKLGLILLIVAAVVIAGFGLWTLTKDDDTETPAATTGEEVVADEPTESSQTEAQPAEKTFTAAEVAKHSTKSDCWTIISGGVYDLTSFVSSHPGGDEILAACGTDGTSLFEERETEDGQPVGSGTPHSSNATSILSSLQIGVLE